ncbi:MAG: hypothetical protein ACJ8LG_00645 [Massilia sp.]
MANTPAAAGATVFSCSFSGSILLISGLVLVETWSVGIRAGAGAHVFIALVGLFLGAAAFSSYRRSAGIVTQSEPGRNGTASTPGITVIETAWCILFCALGNVLIQLLIREWRTTFLVFVAGLAFVPWSKVVFCRRHFVVACAMFVAGGICGLVLLGVPADPIILPVATWILWISAAITLLRGALVKTNAEVPTSHRLLERIFVDKKSPGTAREPGL